MIVLDGSAAVEWLLQTSAGKQVARRIFSSRERLYAPHLLDGEVLQVLRRHVVAGELSAPRAEETVEDLRSLRISRYPHVLFVQRVWELRHNLTAYDAVYVALAEALDATLLTCDAKLGLAPGHHAGSS